MTAKLDGLKIAQQLASERNGKCLSEKYINISSPLDWYCCICRHQWKSNLNHIKNRGDWCPKCANKIQKTEIDYYMLADKNNGKCLFISNNCNSSSKWQCSCGYVWLATYSNVKQGHWCPKCSGNIRKTESDYHYLAENNNGKCLVVGKNSHDKNTKWQCNDGHIWNSSYDHINQGRWCLKCSGKARKTKDDYYRLAEKNDGKCLFVGTNSGDNISTWQCKNNHIWQASYSSIKQGSWCPECSNGKGQKLLSSIFAKLFPMATIKNNFKDFNWLYNKKTKGTQELDLYIPELKLAIEYDGEQHFKAKNFFGGKEGFRLIKRRDKLKNKKVASHPEDVATFIRIPYTEPITKDNIVRILKENGITSSYLQ